MPIRLSDTQKITNVPSSRDIGSLVNLDDSRSPLINQPTPPLPRIQSGLAVRTETFQLIDRVDYSSSSSIFPTYKINFPLGNFERYRLVFKGVDFSTAPSIFMSFEDQTNTYYSEYASYNGSTVGVQQSSTSTSYMTLGTNTSFPVGSGGVYGAIEIYFPQFNGDSWGSVSNGPQASWNLYCWSYRTHGHGLTYSGSTSLRSIQLNFTYLPTKGTITCYGLPRS